MPGLAMLCTYEMGQVVTFAWALLGSFAGWESSEEFVTCAFP